MSKPFVSRVSSVMVPGWYGKLPNLGDFASRRLPETFIERWDRWLQDGLLQARRDAGEQWRAIYLVSPIRRFWVGPGAIDANAWLGLMMPSVDRVGRYFPLTFAMPAASLASALAASAWFDALDRAARRVLDARYTVDDLEAALLTVSRVQGSVQGSEQSSEQGSAGAAACERLAAALQQRCASPTACSVWWCGEVEGDAADDASVFQCFAGLPPPTAFGSWLGELG